MTGPYVGRNLSFLGEAVIETTDTSRSKWIISIQRSRLTSFGKRTCVHALVVHCRFVGDNFATGVIAVPATALRTAKRARISWLYF